ncbi:DUF1674 domain-containing protein [Luteimonas wenzhouensis]|uniref:DUF1674 domain-containing protein n=1 Tax=Luteimonas wenzhouensis TaxID=2599615 RepID=A0A5C5U7K0_9GAMM|nr:DUF1674 domain-containing protein [Luteimonas wenzhouensis]
MDPEPLVLSDIERRLKLACVKDGDILGDQRSGPVTEGKPRDAADAVPADDAGERKPVEYGGRDGPDPTRYGDWEKNGRCIDF